MMKKFKKEIIDLDKKIRMNFTNNDNTQEYINNYFSILENDVIIEMIYQFYNKIKKTKGVTFEKEIKKLSSSLDFLNLNYSNNLHILNNIDFLFSFISFTLIKEIFSCNFKIDDDDVEYDLSKYYSYNNTYNLANSLLKNTEKLIVFLDFINIKKNFNKEKKEIRFPEKNLLNIFTSIIKQLDGINGIKLTTVQYSLNGYKTIQIIKLKEQIYVDAGLNVVYENLNYYSVRFEKDYREFIIGGHYSQIYIVFKKNKFSGKKFKLKEIKSLTEKLNDNWIYVDKENLEYIFKKKLESMSLSQNDLEKEYDKYRILYIKYLEEKRDIKEIKAISKEMSKLIEILKYKSLLKNLNFEKKIFLPYSLDFRGRIYYESDVSPTNSKELRYCMNRGFYSDNIKIDLLDHNLNIKVNNELDNYLNEIDNWKYSNFKDLDITLKRAILWNLISIAETSKTKIGKNVSLLDFIDKGKYIIENINLFENNYEKYIKIWYHKKIIDELKNKKIKKWLISKDATASCYQHLIKLLGYKNKNSLIWCNLLSLSTWYDTYSYIIDEFKNIITNDDVLKRKWSKKINDVFIRENLKKIIMSENYGCKYKTALDYFLDNIDSSNFDSSEFSDLLFLFKTFFDFLSKNNMIFKKNPNYILEAYFGEFQNTEEVILKDGSQFNVYYHKKEVKQFELKINNKRNTINWEYLNFSLDYKKIKTSFRANLIHSYDAYLVRWFLLQTWGITIHDCFMIDHLNTSFLISKINEGMRLVFHDSKIESQLKQEDLNNLFSIFIVL